MLEAASRPTSELLNANTAGGGNSKSPAATAATGGGMMMDDDEQVDMDMLIQNQEALDLIFTYVLSDEGAFLRDALIEDVLGALEDANLVVLRGLSLLSGGLLAPPSTYPDRDRLSVVGSLLQNLTKMATDRGFSSGLSNVQSTALIGLSRQVLAAYAERQALKVSRGLFHRLEDFFQSRRKGTKAAKRGGRGRRRTQSQLPPDMLITGV